jgi:multicomponent K+:H+ antiporter subunit G
VSAAPVWVDALTAVFLVLGAVTALIGSFGLLRVKTFFQRVHPPSLVATVGTWGITLATVVDASFATRRPYLHAILVPLFVALTAPVTTVLLTRAALFRARRRGDSNVPPPTASESSAHSDAGSSRVASRDDQARLR